jgi:hypothetical protein
MTPACTTANNTYRTWLGNSAWDLRYRNGWQPSPPTPPNGAFVPAGFNINNNFIPTLDAIFGQIDYWMIVWNLRTIDWIGSNGANVCKANSWHANGQAFDLAAVYYSPDWFVDCNTTWRPERTLASKRLYLAIAATARRFVATVITAYWTGESAHDNHIHLDNGTGLQPINSGWWTDTTLIQSACNLLTGTSLALDGVWGSQTNAAYLNLRNAVGMSCYDPRGNLAHAQLFLAYIAHHGFANHDAGWFRAGC